MIVTVPAFLVCSCAPLLDPKTLRLAYGIPISLCSVFFAWLLVRAVRDGPASSSWGGLVLPKIGAMSYGIYLIHYTMLAAVYPLEAGSPSIALRCAALAATLVMAWLSFRFFEGPMMKLGRRMTV
jgi:peptidoglycan/LPS O-acetylase OafA/YrhL